MRYMGSKQKISKYIVPIIQKYIDQNDIHYYLEPMCGGLNVIDKIRCDRKFAYDLNKYLIYLFIHVKSGGKLPEVITKETYDAAREAWHNDNNPKVFEDWFIGCCGWLCSYNGRGFDGGYSYDGYEHRNDGTVKYRNYYDERKRNLIKQFEQPLCQDIMFGISDYRRLESLGGYLLYVDPPYQDKKQYANATEFNYDEFWDVIRKWSQNNIVLISELTAPDDFECIWEQEVTRVINPNNKKIKAIEKIFKFKV